MPESDYIFKATLGSLSIEAHGPKEFVQPIYDAFKPLLDREIKNLLKAPRQMDEAEDKKKVGAGGFPKKASIKEFYGQKKPSSDIQATTLVAFFYSELAEPEERSAYIDAEILQKGFKACNHPMPADIPQTLRNAKNYGYLEGAGEAGKFKLTPTGYNLVAHSLPTSDKVAVAPKRRRARQTSPKKKH